MNRSRLFTFLMLFVVAWGGMTGASGFAFAPLQQQESEQQESEKQKSEKQESEGLSPSQLAAIKQLEENRIAAIEQVIGSVVAIYDDDRQGGGSGVIIDPSGIALTNHHVIMGSGVSGWGGLADGKLYRWDLIGTDPGGDVAIIQMKQDKGNKGKDFPFTPLGDSDEVRVGDWALAMGNPFILTEDQAPTVTLGIVSGVKRYQPGAGNNQLVYGNCIQVDSSINPGNSGGPLFNLDGRVIGINGRGSFKERGRVNVGLGYAISANQIKNFIPDLLATKLTEHATLDLQFEDRNGKVLCSRRDALAPISEAGLELGDELIEFEGVPIKTANQFTNLICTLPEQWPIELKVRKPNGSEKTFHTRAFGLPYRKPSSPRAKPNPTPQEKRARKRQLEMLKMLKAVPGAIRVRKTSRRYADRVIAYAKEGLLKRREGSEEPAAFVVTGTIGAASEKNEFELTIDRDGSFRFSLTGQLETDVVFDGKEYFKKSNGGFEAIAIQDLIRQPQTLFAIGLAAVMADQPFAKLPAAVIDGSDKARGGNAWRMAFNGDQSSFYGWFQMYGDAGLPEPQLVKLASDRDADQGGVVFDRWEQKQNRWLPVQGRVVIGLAEKTLLTIEVDSVTPAAASDVDFSKLIEREPDSKTPPKKDAEVKE